MASIDLNVMGPEQVAAALREAAEQYRISTIELQSAWQDENAGKVWDALAKALEQAANQCDKACSKYHK